MRQAEIWMVLLLRTEPYVGVALALSLRSCHSHTLTCICSPFRAMPFFYGALR